MGLWEREAGGLVAGVARLARGLAIAVMAAVGMAAAPTAADLLRTPEFSHGQISPDGRTVALIRTEEPNRELVFFDLAGSEPRRFKLVRSDGDGGHWRGGVREFRWIGPRRLMVDGLFLSHDNVRFGSGWSAVDLDGGNFVKLPGSGQRAPLVRTGEMPWSLVWSSASIFVPPDDAGAIMVSGNEDGWNGFPDLLRIDTRKGTARRWVRNPGKILEWVLARDGRQVGLAEPKGTAEVWEQAADGRWGRIADLGIPRAKLRVLDYDSVRRLLHVARPGPAGYHVVQVFRLNEAVWGDVVAASERYDVAPPGWPRYYAGHDLKAPVWFAADGRLAGVGYAAERPVQVWSDPGFERAVAAAERALPGRYCHWVGHDEADKTALVLAWSDRDPGTYAAVDLADGRVRPLVRTMPWLKPADLARVRPIRYRAADGLMLDGMITLPPGAKPGQPGSLVVLARPMPWRRELGTFEPLAQWLALRGHAVLQVNYRGSYGYGADFTRAGPSAIGREIQRDLGAAVQWAVDEKIADPGRVAAVGTGFGGHAALLALVRDEGFARCAAVVDAWLDWEAVRNAIGSPARDQWFRVAEIPPGAKSTEEWRALSWPRTLHPLQGPLLIVQNANHAAVPAAPARALARAIQAAGGRVESWFHATETADPVAAAATQAELFGRIDAFLGRHLGPPGSTSAGSAGTTAP